MANKHEWLNAVLLAVRDRMVEASCDPTAPNCRRMCARCIICRWNFCSAARSLNTLLAMGIYEDTRVALDEIVLELDDLLTEENDPGLGNGGLGRLSACFLDSMATLALPGCGYGIRYEYGMFKQNIVNGQQAESPDYWLEYAATRGSFPATPAAIKSVSAAGYSMSAKICWVETEEVLACAYDQIIPGFDTDTTKYPAAVERAGEQ